MYIMRIFYASTTDDRPTLHELQMLEGVDGRKVRVIERVAPDWKDLAIALGKFLMILVTSLHNVMLLNQNFIVSLLLDIV